MRANHLHIVPLTSMQEIAQSIYEISDLFNKFKKYKIAAILNMTPETFSRNLKALKKDGIVTYGGGKFKVLDQTRLLTLFDPCKILH